MYKDLSETEDKKTNQFKVRSIRNTLSKIQNKIRDMLKNNMPGIEENEKIISIVEHILKFNRLNQSRKGLKILTPNQILSRLPISLAQLQARNTKSFSK